jgi:hypothetical protein
MKLTIVDFSGGAEGITALYIDGKLHTYGDYYHNKITEWINGFIAGLIRAGVTTEENKIYLPEESPWIDWTWDLDNPPPDTLKGLNSDPE